MKFFKLALMATLIVSLASCAPANDPALVGVWVTDSPIAPVNVVTFDGKTCSMKEALLGNTTQLQYKTDTKEGKIYYYAMGDNIETAKPTSSQTYTIAGMTLKFGSGSITYEKRQ
jgi:hypothetical protein